MTSARSRDVRIRPQTSRELVSLQAIRYEDTTTGVPPLPGYYVISSKPSASSLSGLYANEDKARAVVTSPSTTSIPELSLSDTIYKRDSVCLPATVVVGHSAGFEHEHNSKDKQNMQNGAAVAGTTADTSSPVTPDSLQDLDLSDLASEKLEFSARGSLLVAGRRVSPTHSAGAADIASIHSVGELVATHGLTDGANDGQEGGSSDQRPAAEVCERDAHTAQSITQTNGRPLSTEEMTFSRRVRSLYDPGGEYAVKLAALDRTEKAADTSSATALISHPANNSGETTNGIDATQSKSNGEHVETSTIQQNGHARLSDVEEGIEDWHDIDGQTVDRYGFINPRRISSDVSAARPGLQRMATSLQVESSKPRRRQRMLYSPAPKPGRPETPSTFGVDRDESASLHASSHGRPAARRTNPFRTRDKKVVAEAADILTVPPELVEPSPGEHTGEVSSTLKQRERARLDKWQKMARTDSRRKALSGKGAGMRFTFDTSDPKLISRTWKGIPDQWRAAAWHSFLSASARKRGVGASDDELTSKFYSLQDEDSADDVQIDMDVPRTINQHVMFRRRYKGGQRLLFRVLHAIGLYFPDTGYVQGMASLAATLLSYFEEERAFVMMVRLWQLRGLEQLFETGFGGLMQALSDLEKDWLKGGDVARKLEQLGVDSTAYGTRWYLMLFNMSIPFPAQLRVWDVFILLGDASPPMARDGAFGGADLDVLHAASAALIDATREIVLDSDFENAMKVLTSFVPVMDEDLFMRVAKAEWKMRKKRALKS